MGPVTAKKVLSIMALCAMVTLLVLPVVVSLPSPAAGEDAAAVDGAKKDGDKVEKGRDVYYKTEGIEKAALERWAKDVGWETLLNRAGTTFRKLPDADKQDLDAARAVALMAAHPSCIRRPAVEHDGGLLVGFDPAEWERALV